MRHVGLVLVLGLLASGCAFDSSGVPDTGFPDDHPDDDPVPASVSGEPNSLPGDAPDIPDEGPWEYTSAERNAILDVANIATVEELDEDVPLDSRAAENIVEYRDGADIMFGTTDDNLFDDLFELDAISYVGDTALDNLLAYAYSAGYLD
jgi:hypothetical protein